MRYVASVRGFCQGFSRSQHLTFRMEIKVRVVGILIANMVHDKNNNIIANIDLFHNLHLTT